MRFTPLTALAVAVTVAACNEGPFLDQPIQSIVGKPVNTLEKSGVANICYRSESQLEEVRQIARETCAAYGLESQLIRVTRYQCRLTTPHRATFRCYHPDMVGAKRKYINPLNEREVAKWQRRTGKPVPGSIRRNPEAPAASDLGAPPPAQLTPVPPAGTASPPPRTSTPGELPASQRPAPAATPLAPVAPAAAAPDGFSLPMGSWDDAFERQD